jgi:hypothetical protein
VGRGFSFTDEALANRAVYDVTPGEVGDVLSGTGRVIRHLGDDPTVVHAATRRGRRLAVLNAETVDGWDVLSARPLRRRGKAPRGSHNGLGAVTMDRSDAVKRFHDDELAEPISEGEPAELPTPGEEQPMVSRSVRLPVATYARVRAAAEARRIGVTTLMRQWIEAGLADLDDSATVSLADLRRALATLPRSA